MSSPSRGTPCAGTAPAPQAARWLFAICPYVAKLLAAVALRKGILGPVRLYPDSVVAEAWQTENILSFESPRQGCEEKWEGNDIRLFGR
jgi:hypothetical protein